MYLTGIDLIDTRKNLSYAEPAKIIFDNQILTQLKPDIIMISMCNNYSDYDHIRNIFKFRYGRIIDFFAKSELMKMIDENGNKKTIFDFSLFHNEKEFVVSLKDPLLVQHLSKLILPKIKLPNGVMII